MASDVHTSEYHCFGCQEPEDRADGELKPVPGVDGQSPRLHCRDCRKRIAGLRTDGLAAGWNTQGTREDQGGEPVADGGRDSTSAPPADRVRFQRADGVDVGAEAPSPETDGGTTESATDQLADLLDMDGLEGLGDLAASLKSQPLHALAVTGLGEAISELADGSTETYMNTNRDGGVDRLAVVTDDQTVRVLMLTADWKWRGPYAPEDPHRYLEDRGYEQPPDPVTETETDEGEAGGADAVGGQEMEATHD